MTFNDLIETGSSGQKWPSIVEMMEAKGMFEVMDTTIMVSAKQHGSKLDQDKIIRRNKT